MTFWALLPIKVYKRWVFFLKKFEFASLPNKNFIASAFRSSSSQNQSRPSRRCLHLRLRCPFSQHLTNHFRYWNPFLHDLRGILWKCQISLILNIFINNTWIYEAFNGQKLYSLKCYLIILDMQKIIMKCQCLLYCIYVATIFRTSSKSSWERVWDSFGRLTPSEKNFRIPLLNRPENGFPKGRISLSTRYLLIF